MDTLISVIIPAYNIQDYLGTCLDCVLGQRYRDLEVIVVDDGSTDATPAIADAYAQKDPRVRVIHQANSGVTCARFQGLRIATGDYIGFVDGDDQLEPEMYELLLRNAREYDADISGCGYRKVYAKRTVDYFGTDQFSSFAKREGVRNLLDGRIEPGLCNKLYRASLFRVFETEHPMDLSIKNNEDRLMNYYLFSAAERSVFEDKCLYRYIVRKGSATHPVFNDEKFRDPIKVWNILLEETKNDPELNALCLTQLTHHLIRLATMSRKREGTLQTPLRTEARNMLRDMLPHLWGNRFCGMRIKAIALLAAFFPRLYARIHSKYRKKYKS